MYFVDKRRAAVPTRLRLYPPEARTGCVLRRLGGAFRRVRRSTALYLKDEVSDGVIAPGYTPEALEILKLEKGAYNVVRIDPDYVPPGEHKDVFRHHPASRAATRYEITTDMFTNIVTKNTVLPRAQKLDMARRSLP